ncbi:DMT family transporter [Streptomyces sp. WAC 06725]|uniref:DMT family transporter n=1 Tax=Streptomyces sp. WAC 06725 TaxID=2203209 RepID=UPI0021AD6F56|nr:DMT family transporter [Streptomyces sp. WAC 06725]
MTGRCRASSTALAYWLFSAGVPSTSAATVGTLSLAEPLAASILGVFVLHEHLTPTALLGSLLLMGGLAAACLPVARTRSAAEPRDLNRHRPWRPSVRPVRLVQPAQRTVRDVSVRPIMVS